MGKIISRLFTSSSGPMLELDNVQCCNGNTESSDSSSSEGSAEDPGVVYSGRLGLVVRQVLESWPVTKDVEVHVRTPRA